MAKDYSETYAHIADKLTRRVLDLIPTHPEILTMQSPFELFKIKEFKCDDLAPSLNQAGWALSQAILEYKKQHGN